jgi:hypothetical protein
MIIALYSYFVKIERFEPIAGARPELVAEWVRREFTANQDTGCTRVNKLMFGRFLSDSVWPIFGLQSWAQLRDKAMVALDDHELEECLTRSALDDAFVNFRGDLCPTFRFADAFDVMCATGATAEGEMRGTSASMSNFHDADVGVYGTGGAKEHAVPEPGDWVSKSTKTDQRYIDWAFEGKTLVIHSGGVEPINAVLQKMAKLVTESSAVVFKIGDDAFELLGLDGGAIMCMPTGDGGRTKWGPRLCFKPAAARVEAGGTFTLFLNYPNPGSVGFAGYHARGAAEVVECMSGSARLLLAMRAVASPKTFGANDLVFQASMEVSRLQLKRQVSEIDAEKRVQRQNYRSSAARGGAAGGAIGGAADASEETKDREGYGPGEKKWTRAGAAGGPVDASAETKARLGWDADDTKWYKAAISLRSVDNEYAAIARLVPPDFLRLAGRQILYLRNGTEVQQSGGRLSYCFIFDAPGKGKAYANRDARPLIAKALLDNPLWNCEKEYDPVSVNVYTVAFTELPATVHQNWSSRASAVYLLLQIGYTVDFRFHDVTPANKEATKYDETSFDECVTETGAALTAAQLGNEVKRRMQIWDVDQERLRAYIT